MIPEHPDTPAAYHALKAIKTGGRQAIEDKAIAAYMRAYEERGKEEAEKQYFETFNKKSHEIQNDQRSVRLSC